MAVPTNPDRKEASVGAGRIDPPAALKDPPLIGHAPICRLPQESPKTFQQ